MKEAHFENLKKILLDPNITPLQQQYRVENLLLDLLNYHLDKSSGDLKVQALLTAGLNDFYGLPLGRESKGLGNIPLEKLSGFTKLSEIFVQFSNYINGLSHAKREILWKKFDLENTRRCYYVTVQIIWSGLLKNKKMVQVDLARKIGFQVLTPVGWEECEKSFAAYGDMPPTLIEEACQVGLLLIDAFNTVTGLFEMKSFPEVFRTTKVLQEKYLNSDSGKKEGISHFVNQPLCLVVKRDVFNTLFEGAPELLFIKPKNFPMLVKPVDWDETEQGGLLMNKYIKSRGGQTFYVEGPAGYNLTILDKYDATLIKKTPDMRLFLTEDKKIQNNFYTIINKLQSQKWRINLEMVTFIKSFFKSKEFAYEGLLTDKDIADIKQKSQEFPIRKWPKDLKEAKQAKEDAEFQRLFHLGIFYQRQKDNYSTRRATEKFYLKLLEFFAERDIYFVYSVDARGRCYVNSSINYQGPEWMRSCFDLGEEEELTEEGFSKFQEYGPLLCGLDKFTKISRNVWLEENEKKILDYKNNLDWIRSNKKPSLLLRWCIEYKKINDSKLQNKPLMTNMVYWIDASVNAIQHLAAIGRFSEFVIYLNMTDIIKFTAEKKQIKIAKDLIFSDYKRLDLYEIIAEKCNKEAKRLCEEGFDLSIEFRERLKSLIDINAFTRKLVKKQAMSYAYGVTETGMREQTQEILNTPEYLLKTYDSPEHTYIPRDAYLITRRIIAPIIQKYLAKVGHLMFLMQAVALGGQLAAADKFVSPSLKWKVPLLGYFVVSHYRDFIIARSAVRIRDKRKYFTYRCLRQSFDHATKFAKTNRMKKRGLMSQDAYGIVPNFIHSIDAATLLTVVKEAKFATGIIHDSIGILSNHVEDAQKLFKEVFIKVHETDPYLKFFENLNIKEIQITRQFASYGLNNLGFPEEFLIKRGTEQDCFYIVNVKEFLEKTRGTFNLSEIRQASYFIS